jgi:SAM-dependent methyltransferase
MDDLPFDLGEIDVIWSEGAIYNMGFENGLKKWKQNLKVGGYLTVSEITWITPQKPKEIEEFWQAEYPEVDTASRQIKQLEDNGYTPVEYFYLGQDSWIENYYKPVQLKFDDFLKHNNQSDLARKVVQDALAEIDLYLKYKEYYSYGFYIARNN